MPARAKFLVTEKIRMMDEVGEPTHIPAIFWDLFESKFSTRRSIGIDGARSLPRHDDNLILTRYIWALVWSLRFCLASASMVIITFSCCAVGWRPND